MGGLRIDDHKWWGGGSSKASVFPEGVKTKRETSAGSAGELNKYEDTTEAIRSMQEKNMSKAKAHPLKPTYRN